MDATHETRSPGTHGVSGLLLVPGIFKLLQNEKIKQRNELRQEVTKAMKTVPRNRPKASRTFKDALQ